MHRSHISADSFGSDCSTDIPLGARSNSIVQMHQHVAP
jgi:hypothetical protein